MREKKIAASLLCGVTAASLLAGCGEVDKSAVVATFDDTEVSLGVANFAARLQQASYDDFYAAYFGNSVWDSDLYGGGTTMEDEVKSGVLDSLFESYTLQAHAGEYGIEITDDEKAAITAAASEFIGTSRHRPLRLRRHHRRQRPDMAQTILYGNVERPHERRLPTLHPWMGHKTNSLRSIIRMRQHRRILPGRNRAMPKITHSIQRHIRSRRLRSPDMP